MGRSVAAEVTRRISHPRDEQSASLPRRLPIGPAQQAGLRSFALERAQDSATAAAGLSRIFSSGATRVRGKLNDGRAFSTSSALAKNGDCPFYLSLNRGTEMVIGWLNFAAGQGPTASGTVLWVKTGTNAFATTLQATAGQ